MMAGLTELAQARIFPEPLLKEQRCGMQAATSKRPRRAGIRFRAPFLMVGRSGRPSGLPLCLLAVLQTRCRPATRLQDVGRTCRKQERPIMIHDYRFGSHMGFEHPRPRKMRAAQPHAIPPHHPWLSDYLELRGDWRIDVDSEQATWPEMVDQTRLSRFCGAHDFDDAEEDDPCGGNVTDDPHDAREEDGI